MPRNQSVPREITNWVEQATSGNLMANISKILNVKKGSGWGPEETDENGWGGPREHAEDNHEILDDLGEDGGEEGIGGNPGGRGVGCTRGGWRGGWGWKQNKRHSLTKREAIWIRSNWKRVVRTRWTTWSRLQECSSLVRGKGLRLKVGMNPRRNGSMKKDESGHAFVRCRLAACDFKPRRECQRHDLFTVMPPFRGQEKHYFVTCLEYSRRDVNRAMDKWNLCSSTGGKHISTQNVRRKSGSSCQKESLKRWLYGMKKAASGFDGFKRSRAASKIILHLKTLYVSLCMGTTPFLRPRSEIWEDVHQGAWYLG